jgi:protein-S-isoprenylcysteine O-methyltransferase Ste14
MAKIDIRFPLGLLFSILGLLLTVFGVLSDPSLYRRSLGININLWWGLVLFAAGACTLLFSHRAMGKRQERTEVADNKDLPGRGHNH